ncbi:MAG: nucleotide exchange factor GrpE [Chloroflexota bacterium]
MTDQADQEADFGRSPASIDPRLDSEVEALGTEQRGEGDDPEALRMELARAREEVAELNDKYLRSRADMDNFRKRVERTHADMATSSKRRLLRKILGVKDNLERALQYGDSSQSGEGIMEGIRLTQYQLNQLLEQEGVKPIEADGRPFDPRLEEAIQSVHDPSVPDNTVVQTVQGGYTHEDEVLRPAQVIVSVHPE